MLKKVKINTLLVSVTDNGEDRITSHSEGVCKVEETGLVLHYHEKDNQGTAQLLISDDIADLNRKGQTRSRMTFIEGRMLPCPYTTPQGDLDLSLFTHSFTTSVNANGGRFQARYTMMASGRQVADNVLTVEFTFID